MINKYRPYAMGINQTMGSSAAILGTFVAAGFVKHNAGGRGGWQWAYYFQSFVYAVAGISVFATYFPPPPVLRRRGNLREIFARVDYVGILLLCALLASLILGLTWGDSTYPWSSGKIIAMLTCGCGGLVLFGLHEWLGKSDGLFDHRLLQTANFPILLFVCMVDGMLLLGVNVLYSQEIADLFTTDAVNIALILSPYLITSTFGCLPAASSWLKPSPTAFCSSEPSCGAVYSQASWHSSTRIDWPWRVSFQPCSASQQRSPLSFQVCTPLSSHSLVQHT
jgi:MFS family permease